MRTYTAGEIENLVVAYRNGRSAFMAGKPLTDNPYPSSSDVGKEWVRAYKVARKRARFDATIAARSKA